MKPCRSQHTYPTTAAEYELEKEVGKGACGMVRAQPWSAALCLRVAIVAGVHASTCSQRGDAVRCAVTSRCGWPPAKPQRSRWR